jgi:hypothetical protein
MLFRKDLTFVLKGFELQSIATGIQKEHGGLLAYLSFEPDIRFNDEFDPVIPKLICQ